MNFKKAILAISMVAVFSLDLVNTGAKADTTSLSLQVDDKPFVASGDVTAPYVNHDGRTMVPLRFISEAMGASVTWNGSNQQAMIQKGDTTIYVTVGLSQIVVNGSNVDMDTTAENTNGSVFVPARYVAEALGADVEWDAEQSKVYILSNKTNNFARYGLNSKVQFPYTIEDNGIRFTLFDLHIYPVDSADAKQYIDKYGLKDQEKGTPIYFVWAHISLKNISDQVITSSHGIHDFEISSNGSDGLKSIPSNKDYHDLLNSSDYLYQWRLDPDQDIPSSYQGFFIHKAALTYIDLDSQLKSFGDLATQLVSN